MRRMRTKAREGAFARNLAGKDWGRLATCDTVDEMAEEFKKELAELTEQHFPLARVRRRSIEDPWINRKIRRLWNKKIREYKRGGKTEKWLRADGALLEEIRTAKEEFVERLLDEGNSGKSFCTATRKLAAAKSKPGWSVMDLFVGMSPGKVCDKILGFFVGIARSEAPGIPEFARAPGGLPEFRPGGTAEMLKNAKKTNSIIRGDPSPD